MTLHNFLLRLAVLALLIGFIFLLLFALSPEDEALPDPVPERAVYIYKVELE